MQGATDKPSLGQVLLPVALGVLAGATPGLARGVSVGLNAWERMSEKRKDDIRRRTLGQALAGVRDPNAVARTGLRPEQVTGFLPNGRTETRMDDVPFAETTPENPLFALTRQLAVADPDAAASTLGQALSRSEADRARREDREEMRRYNLDALRYRLQEQGDVADARLSEARERQDADQVFRRDQADRDAALRRELAGLGGALQYTFMETPEGVVRANRRTGAVELAPGSPKAQAGGSKARSEAAILKELGEAHREVAKLEAKATEEARDDYTSDKGKKFDAQGFFNAGGTSQPGYEEAQQRVKSLERELARARGGTGASPRPPMSPTASGTEPVPPAGETKVVNGVTYAKVPGGWRKVS